MSEKQQAQPIPRTYNEKGVENDKRFWQRGQNITNYLDRKTKVDKMSKEDALIKLFEAMGFDYENNDGIEAYTTNTVNVLNKATKEQLEKFDNFMSGFFREV